MTDVIPATDVPAELQALQNFEAHSETITDTPGFADGTHYVQALINDSYYVGYGMTDAEAFADMLANNSDIQAAIDATAANGQHDAEWFFEQQFSADEFGGGAIYDPPPVDEFQPIELDMGILAALTDHLIVA